MHGYDVDKLLHLNLEIHAPWVRGSGRRGGGQYGHKLLMHLMFKNLLLYSNEDVHQSYRYDIVKAFKKSSGKRIITVNGVDFPCFILIELSSIACSYLVMNH